MKNCPNFESYKVTPMPQQKSYGKFCEVVMDPQQHNWHLIYVSFMTGMANYGYLNSIQVGSNRMLITAWKNEKKNRNDFFLFFPRFFDSGNIPVQE